MIEIEGLVHRYGREGLVVLAHIDLTVTDDEIVVLLGGSGSGKTTLLRCIAGLERPEAGSVRLGGEEVGGRSPQERGVALVTQSGALLPHRTVEGNLRFPLEIRGVPRGEQDDRIRATARVLGLDALLTRRPAQLAAGQSQAVSTGRQLTRAPRAFLLDEPLTNTDPEQRRRLRSEIHLLQRGFGISMLYATNDPDDALGIADRIAVLDGGRLVQVDAPRAMEERPATATVLQLASRTPVNLVPAYAQHPGMLVLEEAHALRIDDDGISGDVHVAVRAEDLATEPAAARTVSVPVTVEATVPGGSHVVCHARTAAGTRMTAHLTRRSAAPGRGERIVLHAPLRRIHVFDARTGRALAHGLA
jgi:ABC-type sugar transport system ATPase subunit